tara:strand:- start:264 stop:692 length:429 start_codon:yes stop_codon:yes gene_type:complete
MNKRGISNVIATVLIILLALAAVVIIWSFIQPALRTAGEGVSADCIKLEVKPLSCDVTGDSAQVQWAAGDVNLVTVTAFSTDSAGKVHEGSLVAAPDLLGIVDVSFTEGLAVGDTIRAKGIIETSSGEDMVCPESVVEITCE